MEKYPRCPTNYHRNKKTKLCEPSTKKKKETAVLKTHPVASAHSIQPRRPNSFTQKIHRINQNKQQKQEMMEMKHLIQQLKEKKQATPKPATLKPPTPIKLSSTKANSFTQKIHRVNRNKQEKQELMEMKHLIQQMKNKNQSMPKPATLKPPTPIKIPPTKANSFTHKIHRVNQDRQQKQEMLKMEHLIQQLTERMNSNANKTNQNITEIQQQTANNLEHKIKQLAENVDNNLDKLTKQIYTYIEVTNESNENNINDMTTTIKHILEENKKTNDTIAKNKTELREELKDKQDTNAKFEQIVGKVEQEIKQIRDDQNKDTTWIEKILSNIEQEIKQIKDGNNQNIDWIQQLVVNIEKEMETIKNNQHKDATDFNNLFDKNNEFHTSLNKNLQLLSKKFENSEKDVENEFARLATLLKNKNTKLFSPLYNSVPPPQLQPSLVLQSPLRLSSSSDTIEDKWEIENKTRGPKQSPTKTQGRTRRASPNFFSSPILTNTSLRNSENKTNPQSVSIKGVRFTQKNKGSINIKKGKRRTPHFKKIKKNKYFN